MTAERCNDDGGVGIGAGHTCRCVRESGHPTDDYGGRSHGCTCGALWASDADLVPLAGDLVTRAELRRFLAHEAAEAEAAR